MIYKKTMGNSNNSLSDVICNEDKVLHNYDPKDEINTPENELNLMPFTYVNNGLYHDYDTLLQVYPEIISFTIDEQANYSDAITRRYALNPHFIAKMEISLNRSIKEFTPNTTAIGNLAFVAIHQGLDSKWGIRYIEVINHLKNN